MAKRIEAIQTYRPRIDLGKTITTNALAEHIKRGTALNTGEILNVLRELNEAVIFYCRQGMSVKIDGLGTFAPSTSLDARFDVNLRLDKSIRRAINAPDAFTGRLSNAGNAGLTSDELVAMWNADHHDDPIEVGAEGITP